MAHQVFISHSAKNREVADAICTALEKGGIRCWVAPRDVRPGRSFPGEITRAIQQSKVMLLIFSSHSNNSEQVLREVQLATDSHLPLVRFRIEDVSMNDDLKYFLSTPHWLDALTPPLSDHIARLEVAIKELVGQSMEVTGKNVVDDSIQPGVSPVTQFAVPPVSPAMVSPVAPPPVPKESLTGSSPRLAPPLPGNGEDKTVIRKSSTPWILFGLAALAVIAAILCFVFVVAARNPKPSTQQASTTPPQIQKAEASPRPVSSPTRVAKAKQKTESQPRRQSKATTPVAGSENSDEPESGSAFERAGALKHQNQPEHESDEPKSAFDRAGSGIGSDESSAEPSPDDE